MILGIIFSSEIIVERLINMTSIYFNNKMPRVRVFFDHEYNGFFVNLRGVLIFVPKSDKLTGNMIKDCFAYGMTIHRLPPGRQNNEEFIQNLSRIGF